MWILHKQKYPINKLHLDKTKQKFSELLKFKTQTQTFSLDLAHVLSSSLNHLDSELAGLPLGSACQNLSQGILDKITTLTCQMGIIGLHFEN